MQDKIEDINELGTLLTNHCKYYIREKNFGKNDIYKAMIYCKREVESDSRERRSLRTSVNSDEPEVSITTEI